MDTHYNNNAMIIELRSCYISMLMALYSPKLKKTESLQIERVVTSSFRSLGIIAWEVRLLIQTNPIL